MTNPSPWCPRIAAWPAAALLAGPLAAAAADEPAALRIELNKLETAAAGCQATLLLDNATGHQLSRFQLDLALFDQDGVLAKKLLLDMAPLYDDKQTVVTFLLDAQPCEAIGRVLVNTIPACANRAGETVDCIDLLQVTSRAAIPLER